MAHKNKNNHEDCEKENGTCAHNLDREDERIDNDCKCSDNCTCGDDCDCKDGDRCNENCNCNHEKYDEHKCKHKDHDCECKHKKCDCDDDCDCEDCECEDCDCEDDEDEDKEHKENNYFNDLLRLQAEFDNYRKRMQSALSDARQDGFIDAIENFLPALDSFKMATDMITDQNILTGIKFIEKGILDTLSKMGVNEIDCSGEFDPNFHQAIDVDTTSDAPPGSIVKVAYKGFTYKGKVIRYAQVIVKK